MTNRYWAGYSWLGDVTYEDWQRYHDLMRGGPILPVMEETGGFLCIEICIAL